MRTYISADTGRMVFEDHGTTLDELLRENTRYRREESARLATAHNAIERSRVTAGDVWYWTSRLGAAGVLLTLATMIVRAVIAGVTS